MAESVDKVDVKEEEEASDSVISPLFFLLFYFIYLYPVTRVRVSYAIKCE